MGVEDVSCWSWPLRVLNFIEKAWIGYQTQSWLVLFFLYSSVEGQTVCLKETFLIAWLVFQEGFRGL